MTFVYEFLEFFTVRNNLFVDLEASREPFSFFSLSLESV